MTSTRFKEYPEGRVSNRSTSVMRLVRNNNDIYQLNRMLCCYLCEPRTYERYEEFTELKMGLQKLLNSNLQMIAAITNGEDPPKGRLGRIRTQLLEFNELQRRVVDYRNPARFVS